jgi:fermentation-respiration switch protein FrsA (DUF1100 family)
VAPDAGVRQHGTHRPEILAQRSATRALAALAAAVLTAALLSAAWLALQPDARGLRERAGRLAYARIVETVAAGGSRVEDLELVSTSGLRARCQVRSLTSDGGRAAARRKPGRAAPAAPRGARHPAYLIAAGVETGRRAATFPDVPDAVLAACDYPIQVPTTLEPSMFWRGLPELRKALVDSPATLLLATDYLAQRPDVDPQAIGIVGASFGVPAATVAAALDTRLRAAALLYGGADLPLLFAHNVKLGSPVADRLARLAVWVLTRPVEPARYAGAIAPRPTLVVNAPADPFIPRASAEALQAALRPPKEVRWIPLDHFAAFHERDLLQELTGLVTAWFQAPGAGTQAAPATADSL